MSDERDGGLQLVAMTALPCVGKSAVAYGVARALKWPVLSVDPIDAAMRGEGVDADTAGSAAYGAAAALAAEQLGLGLSVIIDACNAHDDARAMWAALAARFGARLTVIECVCGDQALHRARVAARVRAIPHFPELTWADVQAARAHYRPWRVERLRLDTSAEAPDVLVARALRYVRDASNG